MKKIFVLLVLVMLLAVSAPASARRHRELQGDFISIPRVCEIISERAGTNNIRFEKIELDYDDDYSNPIYEVEFYSGNREYEADVDAVTGKILKYRRDD